MRVLTATLWGVSLCMVGLPALAQGFPGTVVEHGAKGPPPPPSCMGSFTYDTGNWFDCTTVSRTCAQSLGLGTANKNGSFTPDDPDNPEETDNDGANNFYTYDDMDVTVNGSDGKPCTFTVKICVVEDQSGNNPVFDDNVLNATWINGVKGCIYGAGEGAKACWPCNPPATLKSATPTPQSTDAGASADGGATPHTVPPRFRFLIGANAQMTEPVDFFYGSGSDLTFIPSSWAAELGLAVGAPISAQQIDQGTLKELALHGLDPTSQGSFDTATLPILRTGLGPDQSGQVLLLDDNTDQVGLIGGDFLAGYLYVNGSTPEADVLMYAGEDHAPCGAGTGGAGGAGGAGTGAKDGGGSGGCGCFTGAGARTGDGGLTLLGASLLAASYARRRLVAARRRRGMSSKMVGVSEHERVTRGGRNVARTV